MPIQTTPRQRQKEFFMSEFDSPNYVEYSYEKKSEGKVKLERRLMIALYIVFGLGATGALIGFQLYPVVAVVPVLVYILFLCTWRLVKYDVYYEFKEGNLSLGKIKVTQQGRIKKPAVSVHIKDALDIAPYETKEQLSSVEKLYDYSESLTSDKRILVVFSEKGIRAAVLLEATAKLGKLFTSFCPNAHDLKGKDFHG